MEVIAGGSSEAVTGDDDGRASKKAFISNNKLPSSVHKVLSNDDLLIEILLLLPLISLNLFKSVSKHWLSLITSPSFIFRRTQISGTVPPSGLFIKWDVSSSVYDFLSFNSRKIAKRSIVFSNNSEAGTKSIIKQSCNGLLLCYVSGDYRHFIYNPLISMFKMLPPIHPLDYLRKSFNNFRMAFDPAKSPHYKVVHVGYIKDDASPDVYGCYIKIQTYSSETGVWSVWDDRFPCRSFEGFRNGIYWDGAIHWLNGHYNDPFHFKLEIVDRLVLTNIQTPLTFEGNVHDDRKLCGSYASLLFLCKNYHSRNLNIYEMKNGHSAWSIKYYVNLDNMLRRTWRLPEDWCCYNIWSIVLGEREEDSFMVIELSGKVLHYKFMSNTVTKLLDLGKDVGKCDCHEFISSFSHV